MAWLNLSRPLQGFYVNRPIALRLHIYTFFLLGKSKEKEKEKQKTTTEPILTFSGADRRPTCNRTIESASPRRPLQTPLRLFIDPRSQASKFSGSRYRSSDSLLLCKSELSDRVQGSRSSFRFRSTISGQLPSQPIHQTDRAQFKWSSPRTESDPLARSTSFKTRFVVLIVELN